MLIRRTPTAPARAHIGSAPIPPVGAGSSDRRSRAPQGHAVDEAHASLPAWACTWTETRTRGKGMRRRLYQPRRWLRAVFAAVLAFAAGLSSLCEATCLEGSSPPAVRRDVGEAEHQCGDEEKHSSGTPCFCHVLQRAAARPEGHHTDSPQALPLLADEVPPLGVAIYCAPVARPQSGPAARQRNFPLRL
jgi:hypothetical protein